MKPVHPESESFHSSHSNHPDMDVTYAILRAWARSGASHTYSQLSHEYEARTGVRLPPFGTWNPTLITISQRLDTAGLPPLSGLVVLQKARRPGAGFWGCCSRTSVPLPDEATRDVEHFRILREISATDWPGALP